jgi:hypothetical protein
MGYHTVFDVAQVSFQWWIPAFIFIFASLFVGVGWALRTSGDKNYVLKGTIFQIVGGVGFLGALTFFVAIYGEYRNARNAIDSRSYSVAEGVVSDFIPMPHGGHSIESFVVNGVHFQYGSGWGSTTFNSEWNEGFIHDGVEARITYVGTDILKVEVK